MAEETNVNTNTEGEGAGGAQAAQAQQANTPAPATPPAQQTTVQSNLRTFTQEQLDAIIARERSKAVKGMFTAEQMAAKDTSITTLTTERDNANADKAKLQEQLDGLLHEKFLIGKGVPADMVDFYAYKIGKIVDDKTTFEQAAEQYIKDNPPTAPVRMSTGGGVGGGTKTQPNENETMNAIIRGASK